MTEDEKVIHSAAERLADALWKAGMPSEQAYRLAPTLARTFLETPWVAAALMQNGTGGVCRMLVGMEKKP